jgi:hypothetical protein
MEVLDLTAFADGLRVSDQESEFPGVREMELTFDPLTYDTDMAATVATAVYEHLRSFHARYELGPVYPPSSVEDEPLTFVIIYERRGHLIQTK